MSATLDRAWLLAHLPHQGAMNLLEGIDAWDDSTIHARATSHRDPAHPLRRDGLLPVAAGIEYGAQAAAAHGALVGTVGAGLLASVRAVTFHVDRLDDLEAALDVRAEQLGGGERGVLYAFTVSSAGRALLEGRVTVAFA